MQTFKKLNFSIFSPFPQALLYDLHSPTHSHNPLWPQQYVSPALLSVGFPSPPRSNSLLVFNCTHKGFPHL
ncbi:hypothetical protein CRYUN_Cryun03dG0143700 [Craigia yunnanensis]